MSSQSHTADAARPPSTILTPSSDSRLNNGDKINDKTKDRRRRNEAHAMQDLLKPPITVKTHPPKLSSKPRSLQPLMLLPRQHLQLSFLDLSSPYGSFEASQSFESKIKILELEGRIGSPAVVLIARLESDKTVYGIERRKDGLHSLCRLGCWVDLQQLCELATVSCPHLVKRSFDNAEPSDAPRPSITTQLHHENKKRRLAIEAMQSLVKKPTRSLSMSAPSQPAGFAQPLTPSPDNTEPITEHSSADQPEASAEAQPSRIVGIEDASLATAQDIFDNIRMQYFEALYHSMGSLAYFAKGPLSRARATFHLDCDSTLEMNDLIDFLKTLVMTTPQIDKKYRETIPDIISRMKITIQDSEAEQDGRKPKKRKARKMRIGKDGLYPTEDENVRRWWTVHKPQPRNDESESKTEPQETRLQISCLRSRETQLQMIIILEILALEPLKTSDNGQDSQLPGLSPVEATIEAPKETTTKKKNKHNFPLLLDVHADRLSIWQSTALDEIRILEESQIRIGQDTHRSLRNADPLKEFCVDIIVPFFSARLPEQSDSINRKLGGPVMKSPPKLKSKKPDAMNKLKVKPNAVAKRSFPPKLPKTLDNVLSKETERNRRSMSRGPSGMIALMRFASTPTVPFLKRENSEPLSLTSIPKADSSESPDNTSQSSRTGSIRRIPEEEKAKRDALVKAELRDAISTLRRPNRDVIGKAMTEAAERRATTSLSQLRKSKKPTQHPRFQNVVKATPATNRFRDIIPQAGGRQQPIRFNDARPTRLIVEEHGPSSSASLVPSSAPRKRNRDAAFGEGGDAVFPGVKATADLVATTPGRPSTLQRRFVSAPDLKDEGVVLASSPIASRKSPLFLKPPAEPSGRGAMLGHLDSGIGMPSSPPVGGLAETPMKLRYHHHHGGCCSTVEGFVTVTPSKRVVDRGEDVSLETAPQPTEGEERGKAKDGKKKMSIFARLGWDNDDDDDDLA